MNRKTIVYLPDFESQHAEEVKKALREAFPEWKVIKVDIDINACDETHRNIAQADHIYHPDFFIAEGLACFFVHQFQGKNRICVNADLHPSFRCQESLVKEYTEKEKEYMTLDTSCDNYHCTHCWGIFGKGVDRREFSMLHYPNTRVMARQVDSALDVMDELVALVKDIEASQWTDEYGVEYAEYGRVLVRAHKPLFQDVEHYTIPNGVQTIQNGAFYGTDLISINMPITVTKIGHHAFAENKLLEDVVLPPLVEVIDMCTFQNCLSLRHVKLPRMLRQIESDAFKGTALQSIELPEGIQYIAHDAFDDGVRVSISMAHMREMLDDLSYYGRKHDEELYLK